MTEQEFTELAKIRLLGEDESMIEDFISYWTETPINGGKMRWQKEKVFDLKKRFVTWKRNASKYNTNKPNAINGTIDAYNEVLNMIKNGAI